MDITCFNLPRTVIADLDIGKMVVYRFFSYFCFFIFNHANRNQNTDLYNKRRFLQVLPNGFFFTD